MDEKDFWAEIYQLLKDDWPSELESLGFCDWIEVSNYVLGPDSPRVQGNVGLIGGAANEIRFVLYLAGKPEDLSEIRWRRSIPRAESKGWISFDAASQTLELEPMSAK